MKIFEEIGAASAEQNLSTVHKLSISPGNPHRFLANTPTIYNLYYDTGRREYQETGPNSGIISTYDAETFSVEDCLTVVGWYRKALEMCGAKGVNVTEERCRALGAEFCRYLVSWQSATT